MAKLILSSGCFNGNVLKTIQAAHKLKFDGIELMLPSLEWNDFENTKRLLNKYKVKVYTIHMPLFSLEIVKSFKKFLNLNSFLFLLRITSSLLYSRIVNKTLKAAQKLDAENIVIHPAMYLFFRRRAEGNMNQIFKKIAPQKINILLENMEYGQIFTFPEISKLYEFIQKYNLGMTLDTSHCCRRRFKLTELFEKYQNKIKNIHLSNAQGRKTHLNFWKGELDLKTFLKAIQKRKYNGLITFELRPDSTLKSVQKNKELVVNYLKMMNKSKGL